ncbi:hypothetical protein FHS18_000306 [Paenibacillus phyllosphaerae]|uniref:Endospore coat-associated protein YheD n=1 Tax=Paenibacillus phyllosphaerae TaxID=274593 RepID=A0A7W5AT96_9BACL|nr:YheC/YheD family protein [Paenibacillus phyllosphaerae]MBB3108278.1 hypothetical protein [Paenibacillus phyllosphaerae]
MTQTNRPALAILVSDIRVLAEREQGIVRIRMPEDDFCRRLCESGSQFGLRVFVLPVASAAPRPSGADGYVLEDGQWRQTRCPLPDLIYDRAFCSGRVEREAKQLLLEQLAGLRPNVQLGSPLPDKLTMHRMLQTDERLKPLLAPTVHYRSGVQLAALMKRCPHGLFLKPAAGFQGRGTLWLRPSGEGWQADGRQLTNRPVSQTFANFDAMSAWTDRFVRSTRYIVQPYLQLTGEDGNAFDLRSLLQKDGLGRWTMTGIAVRVGAPGSITANLHGGGAASPALKQLTLRFGEARARYLLTQVQQSCLRAAAILEQQIGRIGELGADFGIDRKGRLWLLELNGKPGRQSFEHDEGLSRQAMLKPLAYARYLCKRSLPLHLSLSPPLPNAANPEQSSTVHPNP